MTAPLLVLDTRDYASRVAFFATAGGVYVAKRLPIPTVCVCADGSCRRCYLDDDGAFELSQDV